MQQKKIGNILYVFDVTPYEITNDTDATVIKVQQEVVAGFKELNESLADKIVAYNYYIACVQVPEWAPYVDQDDPEVTITLNASNLTSENVTVKHNGAEVQLAGSYTCRNHDMLEFYLLEDSIYYTASNMIYDKTVGQEHWWYAVGNKDDTIGLTYTDPASSIILTAPCGLSIFDEDRHDWVSMYRDRDKSDPNIATGALVIGRTYSVEQRHGVGEGKTVVFDPDCGTGEQGTVGAAFIPSDSDLTITLSEPPADTYTVHITDSSELYDYVTLKINGETITGWDVTEKVTGVADNSVVDIYPTEDQSDYITTDDLTWDTDHWTVTIDGEDLYISVRYSPEVTITLNASNLTDKNVTVRHNGEVVQLAGSYTCHADDSLNFYPLEDPAYYTASNMEWVRPGSGHVHTSGHWAYHAGATDATIGLTYTAPQNNEEQPE